MSSFRTSKLKYTVQQPLVPHSVFGEAQMVQSKAILRSRRVLHLSSQVRIQHHRWELHFSPPLLLLPQGSKTGLAAHPLYPKSTGISTHMTRRQCMHYTRGFGSCRIINGIARRRKGFIWGNWEHSDLAGVCQTPWKLRAVSPFFLVCMDKICRCSQGREEGDRELKWGLPCCLTLKVPTSLPSYELWTPLTAASVALSLPSLSVMKFYDKSLNV